MERLKDRVKDAVGIAHEAVGNVGRHTLGLQAAGIAFFAMLAAFPAMAAIVSVTALWVDPNATVQEFAIFRRLMPIEAWQLFNQQLLKLAAQEHSNLGIGAIIGFVLTLWSSGAGVRALITSLNIVYMERERRGLVRFYLIATLFTLAVIALGVLSLTTIVATPILLRLFALGSVPHAVLTIAAWIVVLGAAIAVLILFYKYGPSRTPPKIIWTLPGAAFASVGWLLGSLLFSLYVSLFSRYNETYGTLGAVVILLTWFYMSAFLVLLGGEINASIEHETQADTTEGPPRPKGERGASVADADPSELIVEPTQAEASGAER